MRPLLPIVFASVLAAGCAATRRSEVASAPAPADRSILRDALADSFAAEARFSEVSVSVDARRPGVVTLKGEVLDRDVAAAAGRLAGTTRGVTIVYNLLDVESPAARAKAARKKKVESIAASR